MCLLSVCQVEKLLRNSHMTHRIMDTSSLAIQCVTNLRYLLFCQSIYDFYSTSGTEQVPPGYLTTSRVLIETFMLDCGDEYGEAAAVGPALSQEFLTDSP